MENAVVGMPVMSFVIIIGVPIIVIAALILWGVTYDPEKEHLSARYTEKPESLNAEHSSGEGGL